MRSTARAECTLLSVDLPAWRWGVPDWRDASAYPQPDTTPLNRWRWEFLRRRQDYREDWLLYFDRSYRRRVAGFANTPCPEGVRSWEERFSQSANELGLCDRYGTGAKLIDPAISYHPITLCSLFRPTNGVLGFASESRLEQMEREMITPYLFDLKKPLLEQMKAAEKYLRLLQKEHEIVPESRRRQISKWPLYLRILDAYDAGATYRKIGDALIDADPQFDQVKFDKLAALERKAWAKARYDQARGVAFNFPA